MQKSKQKTYQKRKEIATKNLRRIITNLYKTQPEHHLTIILNLPGNPGSCLL